MKKLYATTICDGASDCIPNAEHIERIDELIAKLGMTDEIDDFAVKI